mmetsp:Transcript_33357/g.72138  ORF Transcript_33357/g.72138 Transcript_33357/m.72138 type:complete len:546 (-) Transcript_33357:372-2009(-)
MGGRQRCGVLIVRLPSILLFAVQFYHGASESEEACQAAMNSNSGVWLRHSGGPSRYNERHWSALEWRNDLDATQARIHSEEVATGCHIAGGRTWEIGLSLGTTATNFTVCAPGICNASEASSIVGYAFVVEAVMSQGSSRYRQLPWAEEDLVHLKLTTLGELVTWSSLPLDFVIVGVHGCGSSSLFRNLLLHPQLVWTTDGLDTSFWDRGLLPSADHAKELADLKGSSKPGGPVLLGWSNPACWSSSFVMAPTTLMPHLKVIVILADPVRIFEKFAWYESEEARADPPLPETAWWKVARRIRDTEGGVFARKINEIRANYRGRLIVVHQSSFRDNPRKAYRLLTAKLGIEDFSPDYVVRRHNTWFMNSVTAFCKNQSMLRRIRRLFEADYQVTLEALQESGWPLMSEIIERRSHCTTTNWECGTAYTQKSRAWEDLSGGLLAVSDGRVVVEGSHQERLVEACASLGGLAWHVKVNHSRLDREGHISVCAPAACGQMEVAEGVTHHVLRSTENPNKLERLFEGLRKEDLTYVFIEVKAKITSIGRP